MRATVSFVVKIPMVDAQGHDVTRFMGADGNPVAVEAEAVRFTFHASPRMSDRHRIDLRVHELAGGLRAFLDLRAGAEGARVATRAALERALWPAGRPVVEGEALAEQEEKLAAAWRADDSIEKAGYREMQGMIDRLDFIARWTVLVVDPPGGWEDIADRELADPVFYALWSSHNEALAEAALGKR